MATVQQTAQQLKAQLITIYPEQEAGAIAQEVLEYVLAQNRVQLSLNQQQEITSDQQQELKTIVNRLLTHEPLQYVLGVAHFYGLELQVNQNVLIPRPETEELVDLVIRENRGKKHLRVLDICTGSGCIPVALAANLQTEVVYGLEVSEEALNVAKANAAKYNLPVNWLHQDIFEDVQSIGLHSLDVITSNPPYVLEEEQQLMRANVLEYEPHLALFVPDTDPLKFYKRIAIVGADLLKTGGSLYFEINERYGQETCDVLLQAGYQSAAVIKDLFGKDRIVRAVR
ncbi:peptide chain release factor N(5)-glutamine methyltransferase [Pontibacter sp. KCTC 32443]|uniref:peptide chain release factor N(5)-glutamine methyltransferase n=1 Tax=Pontibacter TaxID=323449 RepID=UPI00164E301D|nr:MULTISPECIES: peptide chain release factor N(5)-glutamine methyltransferase [Pontibacter]MBC5774463.1 peptide chain release factor N(5)-glutamine methyltransferase [Pontibacter sp. KCTC 32443]